MLIEKVLDLLSGMMKTTCCIGLEVLQQRSIGIRVGHGQIDIQIHLFNGMYKSIYIAMKYIYTYNQLARLDRMEPLINKLPHRTVSFTWKCPADHMHHSTSLQAVLAGRQSAVVAGHSHQIRIAASSLCGQVLWQYSASLGPAAGNSFHMGWYLVIDSSQYMHGQLG